MRGPRSVPLPIRHQVCLEKDKSFFTLTGKGEPVRESQNLLLQTARLRVRFFCSLSHTRKGWIGKAILWTYLLWTVFHHRLRASLLSFPLTRGSPDFHKYKNTIQTNLLVHYSYSLYATSTFAIPIPYRLSYLFLRDDLQPPSSFRPPEA